MSFPVILQHDAMQCGIASLLMICKYFGLNMSLDEGNRYCMPTKRGVSLLSISEAARKIGFIPFAGMYENDQIYGAQLPCILHWNNNHFVVLYKISRNKIFHIADPSIGRVKYSEVEFYQHWKNKGSQNCPFGVALTLSLAEDFPKIKPEKKKESRDIKFIYSYLRQFKTGYGIILSSLALTSLFQLAFPYLTQWIVDKGITYQDINLVWLILLGELGILVGKTTSDFIRRWLMLHISVRINISLITRFLHKILRLPISFFDTRLLGDMLQRVSDHTRIQSFLTGNALGMLLGFFNLVIFGIILCSYSWDTFVIFTVFSILYISWIIVFLKRRKIIDYEMFAAQGELQGKTYQFISTVPEIILQGCNIRRCEELEKLQTRAFRTQLKSVKLQQVQEAGILFFNEIKNITITACAALAVIRGNLTLGQMLSIQYIVGQLNGPITQLAGFIIGCQDVSTSLERINEIHSIKEDDGHYKFKDDESYSSGDIVFHGVAFSYDGMPCNNVLKNINFTIPAGKTTAIVGASGSGKTTILKLIIGSHLFYSGKILIGDFPLTSFDKDWWHSRCGIVMQDSVLFSESIARNIAVADGEIDYNRVIQAAKLANIHEFINNLPNKYDTVVGSDGMNVSPGQKQRILIARSIYKNPPYIFFDEATNALDTSNEREITSNITGVFQGKTMVIVAHRLSTIVNADQIIVVENGMIAEVGTHNELLSNKSVYYQLVKNQLQLDSETVYTAH